MTTLKNGWTLLFICLATNIYAHSGGHGVDDQHNVLNESFPYSHLLVIAAFILLLSLRSQQHFRWGGISLAIAILVGIVLGQIGIPPFSSTSIYLNAIIIGGIVASGFNIPALLTGVFAFATGFPLGLDSNPEAVLIRSAILIPLIVIISARAADVLKFNGSFEIKYPWQRIGVRILASWIMAISLLLIALRL
ncbi:MAG: hypothetical protein HQM14_11460 [SAR324 cluster bacterium]|nr:hypothetical protein [SAR324 cluster bacterium]